MMLYQIEALDLVRYGADICHSRTFEILYNINKQYPGSLQFTAPKGVSAVEPICGFVATPYGLDLLKRFGR